MNQNEIHAYAASEAGAALQPFTFDPGPLGDHEVEISVASCGICHSDLSVIDNEWGVTSYPVVPGHEVSGVVAAVGAHVTSLSVGQKVGLGWHSGYCGTCGECMNGDHNLCQQAQATIVGHYGGFADKVRAHADAVVPIPEGVDPLSAGPLFCGGITVFNPLVQFDVKPTDKVGVIGIGGLGHIALQILRAWGCKVTAFTSSESKMEEAKELGAHDCINSRDPEAIAKAAGTFNFIISTVNVNLDWNLYIGCLRPKGRLHFVGATLEPLDLQVFGLIGGQKSVSGTPVGSPATIAQMLAFCARHGIAPKIETFPMEKVNEALDHLKSGKARYRIVLTR